ncbi:MAG: multiheme c-type cytochrome [Fidelibacterota bacterium]
MKNLTYCLAVISILIMSGCHDNSSNPNGQTIALPEKAYTVDETGHMLYSEMTVTDFEPSSACQECHPQHYSEWQQSIHAHAMQDPVFYGGWNGEQLNRPETGERFCLQCHNPVAFVTGVSLAGYENAQQFLSADISEVLKDGIGCDICHTMTGLSSTVVADDNVSANAEYHLNPGENIKYGSIEAPASTTAHESQFAPIYRRSEICLPCHDFVIRGVEAEITFTEWSRVPGLAMSGGMSCQSCHMPATGNHHDHKFIGVDLDLSIPAENNSTFDEIENLLQSALALSMGDPALYPSDEYVDTTVVEIPITVASLTAHAVPSGVSFAREIWVEIMITHNSDVISQSGLLSSNSESLDTDDSQLLLFNTQLLDENDNFIGGVTDAHGIINRTLAAFSERYHTYSFPIPDGLGGDLQISARVLFRPFYPQALEGTHDNLLENLPVIEMASVSQTIPAP